MMKNNFKMDYNDNKGYRQSLRGLFEMNSKNYEDRINSIKSIEELDEETEDEISYDEKAASETMDQIYSKTKNNVLFKNLYKIAASKMLSEDETIGQAVLFSYDYLKDFYLCLVDFYNEPENFTDKNHKYINLLKKIS
jgi:hypothetical protein